MGGGFWYGDVPNDSICMAGDFRELALTHLLHNDEYH